MSYVMIIDLCQDMIRAASDLHNIIRTSERLYKVFPDIKEKDYRSVYDTIEKTYGVINYSFKKPSLVISTIGKVDFFCYIDEPKDTKILPSSKVIELDAPITSAKFVSIPEIVQKYILTGNYDYSATLKCAYEAEQRTINFSKVLEKELVKKGKLKIDEKYHKYFTFYKIDSNGCHVAF